MNASLQFDVPGGLDELSGEALAAWSEMFADHTEQFAMSFGRYFDPTATGAPTPVSPTSIVWPAAPARLLRTHPIPARWEAADASRDEQDEYCEWRTTSDSEGRLLSVTFSTEVPEYWQHIAEHDRDLLLDLYRRLVSDQVEISDLYDDEGRYLRNNRWNDATSNGIAHLRQQSNTLLAAIALAAQATVQRVNSAGTRVLDRVELVRCGALGEPFRNSDPQIADIINDVVFTGSAVSLAPPLGLYLNPVQSGSFQTPDGTDASTFWMVERGTDTHTVRARFEVPAELGYILADVFVDGRPLRFGAQVAEKVPVRIDAFTAPSDVQLTTRPCTQ